MTRLAGFLALCFSAALSGCGSGESEPDRPAAYPVTGVITYKNAPLEEASVTFVPQGQNQPGAFGRTDASGRYSLTTYEPDDGAVSGKYFVTVTKYEGGAEPPSAGVDESDPNYEPPPDNPRPSAGPKSLIPQKYSQIVTSKLEVTVAEGENNFDFSLED